MNLFFLKKRSFWRVAWIVALVSWCIFIFANSLTPAEDSKSQSDGVVKVIEETVQKVDPEFTISPKLVRKLAHFFEFFVLGTLLLLYRNLWKTNATLHLYRTLFFGMAAALFDETLQLTSPGRGSLVADVWLDFSAVVVSATVYSLISCLIKYKKSKKSV